MFDMDRERLLEKAYYIPSEEEKEQTRFVSQILIFSARGTVLSVLKKRETSGNAWDLPGGGVDPNESFLETALREFQEELRITPQIMIPFALSYEESEIPDKKNYAAFTFVSHLTDEITPIVDGIEHISSSWLRFQDIPIVLRDRTKRFDRHLLSHPGVRSMTTKDFMGIIMETMQPSHPSQLPSLDGFS
jgi:8-oxo-dGTP pyrophosphatase MutT (NUDIX family)